MTKVFLLLGGNLSNREFFISEARKAIQQEIGPILKFSSLYESEPWGFQDSNFFLNQVLIAQTNLSPEEGLQAILNIETQLGRERQEKGYSSRIIDIDILFWGKLVIDMENLRIPHPRIAERKFVLTPLCELNPCFVHPLHQKNMKTLLAECKDSSLVRKYSP